MRTVLSVSLPENMSEELDRFARSTGRNKQERTTPFYSTRNFSVDMRGVHLPVIS